LKLRRHVEDTIDDIMCPIVVRHLASIWWIVSWSIDVVVDRRPSLMIVLKRGFTSRVSFTSRLTRGPNSQQPIGP
jgi:hypothetical protein